MNVYIHIQYTIYIYIYIYIYNTVKTINHTEILSLSNKHKMLWENKPFFSQMFNWMIILGGYIYIYIYIIYIIYMCVCVCVVNVYVNAHKTEYMCFNQAGDISTLDGTSLKLVDKFTYLGSNVSSTEKYIDTQLTKAWTAIDKLSIIWKSNLTDKMKRQFLPSKWSCRYCFMDVPLGR